MAFAFRGQRFNVDLPVDDEEGLVSAGDDAVGSNPGTVFVKDITERAVPKAPVAPTARSTSTGFPAHKKRATASRFRQQKINEEKTAELDGRGFGNHGAASSTPSIDAVMLDPSNPRSSQREDIDKENQAKIYKMSDEEIASERQELMQQLSPSLIQRLLRRANIDEPQITDFPQPESGHDSETAKSVEGIESSGPAEDLSYLHDKQAPKNTATTNTTTDDSVPSIHFPRPAEPPALDPSSPNFLTELHEKYFANLPHDPSKLEWMAPATSEANTKTANNYVSSQASLPISALRFSFTGSLLPPSVSNSIPTSKGLHHHGDSPEAAGYTIAELAHLARSSFPTQRCFAFQTLGRILYRLGTGEFGALQRGFQGHSMGAVPGSGDDDDDAADANEPISDHDSLQDLARGLWDCIRQGRVLETLQAEANREGGHVSAKAYATEALWLWRKGGGTEVRAT